MDEGCLAVDASFTKIAITTLHTILMWSLKHIPMSMGSPSGPRAETIQRCLQRMVCWVRVASSICRAEFPDFQITQSFRIFNLEGAQERGRYEDLSVADRHSFTRLAKLCGFDKETVLFHGVCFTCVTHRERGSRQGAT